MAGENEQTIDELNIEINSKANDSVSGIDKLAASIQKLRDITGGGVGGLTGIAASFEKLNKVISNLKGKSGTVSSIVNSFQKLNDVDTSRINGKIDSLKKSLGSLSGMDPEIKSMVKDLGSIAQSGNGGIAENALKLQAAAAKAQATIDQSALKSAKAQEGLKAIAEKNQQIEETARAAATQEQQLTDSINAAIQEHIQQTGSAGGALRSTYPAIQETILPEGEKSASWPKNAPSEINTGSINELKKSMGEVGSAAVEAMNEVAEGSSKASGFVDKLKNSFNSAKERISELGNSSNSFFSMGRFYGWYFILRQIADTFGGMITNINSYIENMNLFDVAMGKSAQSGRKLANSLQSVLGVDAGEAERYMGVFEQMTTSFGIANKQATIMSENFTQLGYDIASYYNISTSAAFEKLQSGLAGQSRALRQLGIDTSSARLQQELYNLGFKEKVKDLSEADKAELIYIAIMKQTTNAQGDMARTIQTPANALRVLQAQFQITGRAIGSIFIPALEAILPPVTAVIEVIGDLASELASFLGFKLPKIDYSSLNTGLSGVADDASKASTGLGDVGDGVDNVGKKAQKANKDMHDLISGFDELNILNKDNSNSDSDSGSGKSKKGSEAGMGNILGGVNLPSYDALSGAIGNRIDALKKKIRDFLEAFKNDPLTTFANALWGVGGAFSSLFGWLSKLDYASILTGISAAVMAYGLTKNPLLAFAIGAVVTALTQLLPQKSRIDVLNGTLATLGAALVLKVFTGMPFKLALGISTLMTSGLVELIGKDNAINLLASSLTGLGVGLMFYTFTGNLPLAVAIGVASSAIAGLAIHFSDLQIAAALLSGLSAALLAFKWGGFSAGSAGLVGLGVAIASFAELNKISPELRAALLGLAGAISGVGLAIKAGFGPEGLIITAVAGAIIGLGVGLIQASEDAKRADLERRFGSISLSAQEVEDVAKRLTTTPWTVKIDAAISAKDKVKEFEKNLKSDIETLNKMNWEVSVGIKLTKTEISTYKETISSFIADAKSYVQQQHYAVSLAIDAILEPGTATYKNLTAFTNKYYSNTQAELDKLGVQLSNEVNKAFADNVLSEGEIIKIQKIQAKMNELLQKIADQKYSATLKSLELDTKDAGVTVDSFKSLQTKIQSNIQDELKQANQNKVTVIEQIEEQYKYNKEHNIKNADQIYKQSLQDAQDAFNKKQTTLQLSGLNISLSTLNSKFKTEIAKAKIVFSSGTKEAFKNGFMEGVRNPSEIYKQPIENLMLSLGNAYNNSIKNLDISSAARANIKDLVSQLQPTENDLKRVATAAKLAGKAVPENVAKGISDTEELKAISGDIEAQHYMIGKKMSTDQSFLNLLSTAKDAGKKIDEGTAQGLTNNLQFVKDAATGTITAIYDSATKKRIEITPTLRQNLKDMGIDIVSNGLVSGVNSKIPDATASGSNAFQGLWDGMKKKKAQMAPWLVTTSKDPLKTFNEQNEIHSPSRAFERSGENIVQGLWNGMSSKWSSFTSWWGRLSIKKPHISWTSGGWQSSGWIHDALSALHLPTQLPKLDVEWRAVGGVFNSPSVIGVGEAGPEAVVPLSENSEWIEKVADSIDEKRDSSNESQGNPSMVEMMRLAFLSALKEEGGDVTVPVSVNVDGEQVANHVYKIQKRNQHRYRTQPT